ncbi:uncharacterized protein STEHIDRAFT_142574 [Stereum hirsutum FP-91666 SS1]|uniref:uncharacterized protein n=1 Tax=Stereum hirsutum (strain FP-91666) TaxID=721885 RepID=UPI000444A29D|nr:uncharacterized protein STEHIDRAFT_142574 [Stereum hirsutum FP-91666 SS1]EIM80627.1 hypothetical protein STEHIDRAFT_142574 [Stereum hirsutum FP-91666 SS1]
MSHNSTTALLEASTSISQGAEAASSDSFLAPTKVYKAYIHLPEGAPDEEGVPVLLKHRFNKQYRHPTLDSTLTRSRVAGEARALIKCLRSGVNVPGIRMVDAASGVLGIEWIEGRSVRFLLGGGAEDEQEMEEYAEDEDDDLVVEEEDADPLEEYGVSKDAVMGMIGTEIAKMHLADIVHGDLTTSNMMLRHPMAAAPQSPSTQLVLIDFGLAYTSALVEDKAVDLYVLERAFASTHPDSQPLFESVLKAYEQKMGKQWTAVGRRLEDVRMRGRKRSMVG